MPVTTPEDLLLLSAQNAVLRALLDETRQYLLRLPPVPVTREFAARLECAVSQPGQVRARQVTDEVLAEAIREVTWLSGSEYMPNGVPLYAVKLEGRRLTFSSAGIRTGYSEATTELARRIGSEGGMVMNLEVPVRR